MASLGIGRRTEDGLSAVALAKTEGRKTEDGLSAVALAKTEGLKTEDGGLWDGR